MPHTFLDKYDLCTITKPLKLRKEFGVLCFKRLLLGLLNLVFNLTKLVKFVGIEPTQNCLKCNFLTIFKIAV